MFEDRWKERKVEDILKEIEREFGKKGKGKKTEEEILYNMNFIKFSCITLYMSILFL